ncbi:hypothetical protein BDZ89DRAFT_1133335 [Hymenopellis radicata]|nr:hypothetical protein BDZ89DRAFT_1133335 [Hymenopellis radicata]
MPELAALHGANGCGRGHSGIERVAARLALRVLPPLRKAFSTVSPRHALYLPHTPRPVSSCQGASGNAIEDVFFFTIDSVNVDETTAADVDRAVKAAHQAFETEWGLNASGCRNHDELAALETLDNGKTLGWVNGTDMGFAIAAIKYYTGQEL